MTKRIDAETIFDAEGFTRGEVSYWIPVILDTHLDQSEGILVDESLDHGLHHRQVGNVEAVSYTHLTLPTSDLV